MWEKFFVKTVRITEPVSQSSEFLSEYVLFYNYGLLQLNHAVYNV